MELFDYEKKHIGILRETLAECTLFLKRDGQFPITAPGKLLPTETESVTL